jgi:hypothetical protein
MTLNSFAGFTECGLDPAARRLVLQICRWDVRVLRFAGKRCDYVTERMGRETRLRVTSDFLLPIGELSLAG